MNDQITVEDQAAPAIEATAPAAQPDSDAPPVEAQGDAPPTEAQKRRVGRISFSELMRGAAKADTRELLTRSVWLVGLEAEGVVRMLTASEEPDVQESLEVASTREADSEAPSAAAARHLLNRRKIVLALSLACVEPTFTEAEAEAAVEAENSALLVGPLFNTAARLNPVFQLDNDTGAQNDSDPVTVILRAETEAAAVLRYEKENGRLQSTLGRSLWDTEVAARVKPYIDNVSLCADLLTSEKLPLADLIAAALAPRVAALIAANNEAPSPTSAQKE
jgi:hypothetical protein